MRAKAMRGMGKYEIYAWDKPWRNGARSNMSFFFGQS